MEKDKKSKIIIAAIGAIVVVLAIILAVVLLKDNKSDDEVTTEDLIKMDEENADILRTAIMTALSSEESAEDYFSAANGSIRGKAVTDLFGSKYGAFAKELKFICGDDYESICESKYYSKGKPFKVNIDERAFEVEITDDSGNVISPK